MIVEQRAVGNGIKKAAVSTVSVPAQLAQVQLISICCDVVMNDAFIIEGGAR